MRLDPAAARVRGGGRRAQRGGLASRHASQLAARGRASPRLAQPAPGRRRGAAGTRRDPAHDWPQLRRRRLAHGDARVLLRARGAGSATADPALQHGAAAGPDDGGGHLRLRTAANAVAVHAVRRDGRARRRDRRRQRAPAGPDQARLPGPARADDGALLGDALRWRRDRRGPDRAARARDRHRLAARDHALGRVRGTRADPLDPARARRAGTGGRHDPRAGTRSLARPAGLVRERLHGFAVVRLLRAVQLAADDLPRSRHVGHARGLDALLCERLRDDRRAHGAEPRATAAPSRHGAPDLHRARRDRLRRA